MNWQDTTVDVNGQSLFVRIWEPATKSTDTRAPIILFHDSLGCVELWRNFPRALSNATQRQVIAYDRLGYGKSSPRSNPQSFDFVGQEAETYLPALLQQLNVDKFIAFGHSVGGGMAVYTAAKFPESCLALITESAQSFVEDRTLAGIEDAKIFFAEDANIARLKKYHGEKALWVRDAWIDTWLSDEFKNWNLKSILPKVHCPVMALHGRDDEYGSVKHPQIIHDLVSGDARLEIIEDCKHLPHQEQEQHILNLVVDFLAEQTTA